MAGAFQHIAGMASDGFDLDRFVEAQRDVYPQALAELRRGAKRGHWMWFVFPQLRGLGRSETAKRFGIASIEEATAYLSHPILGPRLRECVEALQDLTGPSASEVFGDVDALKLRSSLTLFALAEGGQIFDAAVSRWFGSMDGRTLELLGLEQEVDGAQGGMVQGSTTILFRASLPDLGNRDGSLPLARRS